MRRGGTAATSNCAPAGATRVAWRRAAAILFAAALAGCASNRETFTASEAAQATVPGFEDVRASLRASGPELSDTFQFGALGGRGRIDYLALSGGGAAGAFGAGVLCGWTEHGGRPEFDVVSGVSTGALIAPFAFVGSDYDPVLRSIFTEGPVRSLVDQIRLTGIFGDGLIPQETMQALIRPYVDQELLARIAAEHRNGRRLIVVTTNLDTAEPVAWNMGAIASVGGPRSAALFTEVLAASASVPLLVEPAFLETVVDGRTIREMHVDGSATQPILTIPRSVMFDQSGTRLPDRMSLYLVVNSKLQPDFTVVDGDVVSISGRAVSTLIRANERNHVYSTYDFAREEGLDYHLTAVDASFEERSLLAEFDDDYMRSLFRHGYERALAGTAFVDAPPPPEPLL